MIVTVPSIAVAGVDEVIAAVAVVEVVICHHRVVLGIIMIVINANVIMSMVAGVMVIVILSGVHRLHHELQLQWQRPYRRHGGVRLWYCRVLAVRLYRWQFRFCLPHSVERPEQRFHHRLV
jgi:hypothetical protein